MRRGRLQRGNLRRSTLAQHLAASPFEARLELVAFAGELAAVATSLRRTTFRALRSPVTASEPA